MGDCFYKHFRLFCALWCFGLGTDILKWGKAFWFKCFRLGLLLIRMGRNSWHTTLWLSICLVPLDVLYRFCDSTRDVRLIMPICKNLIVQLPRQRPANGLMWFRDVNTKGIRGHVRPFWTEIYYMGVVKNRELKWSFVGALTLSNPIYERGYVLISHRASSPGSPPIWILPSPSSYMVWYPRFKIKMKWMGGQ